MVSWQCVLIRPILRRVQRRKDITRPIELERADFEALASRIPKRRDVQYEHCEVAGTSAGGALVVALLVSARDAGDPLPAAAVCLSPAEATAEACS
jgi:alpha/beta hydrolase family protein